MVERIIPQAVLFDMDGSLCDVCAIAHHLAGPVVNVGEFYRQISTCPPIWETVQDLVNAYEDGKAIHIVTARSNRYEDDTLFWLKNNTPVKIAGLWMRDDLDFRPDHEYKREVLGKIRALGYDVIEAWEDSPSVCNMYEDEGLSVNRVNGYGWY